MRSLMVWILMLHAAAWASATSSARTTAWVPLFRAHSRHKTQRQRVPMRSLTTCSLVQDVASWEAEFKQLKAPMGGNNKGGVGGGGNDLFGGFGRMLPLKQPDPGQARAAAESEIVKNGPVSEVPRLDGHAILSEFPHKKESFTQGLWWDEDSQLMYEGSGGPTFSCGTRVSAYNIETGEIKMARQLPDRFFGEGIAGLGDKIYQLTWKGKLGFIYDKKTLKLVSSWKYDYEGWGMTTNGKELIVSDGTATLHFLDPQTMDETRTLVVRSRALKSNAMAPQRRLNDLQWIDGEIYANVWESDRIAVIDPETGVVTRQIECKGLVDENDSWIQKHSKSDRCLNGIAWDAKNKRILVTGKLWTKIYEIVALPGMGDMMQERKADKEDYYAGSKGASFDPLKMN